MKEIMLICAILLGTAIQGDTDTIACKVTPLESYGFEQLDNTHEEKVCENIIDYTDFTIVNIDELDNVKNGSILKVEFNKDDEVINIEKIKD